MSPQPWSSLRPRAMSLRTLFTDAAAAAHGHEFSCPSTVVAGCLSSLSSLASTAAMAVEASQTPPNPRISLTSSAASVDIESASPARKTARTKSSFHLAQPPPNAHNIHRHRHSFKPSRALIVQVQKLSSSARPLPIFNVLPAAVFGSHKLRKMGQSFKHAVGRQDIIFVGGEQYTAGENEEDDDDEISTRNILASLSTCLKQMPDGKTTKASVVRTPEGLEWAVAPLPNGGYEFLAHDPEGTTHVARWCPKKVSSRRRSYQTALQPSTAPELDERRFQFSMYNHVTRRRPILAFMNRQNIDVFDQHPGPTVSSLPTSPATTPPGSSSSNDHPFGFQKPQHEPAASGENVSDRLRAVIIVTGIWVALKEGYATNNYRDVDSLSSPLALSFDSVSRSSFSASRPSLSCRNPTYPPQPQRSSSSAEPPSAKKLSRHGSLLGTPAGTINATPSTAAGQVRRAQSLGNAATLVTDNPIMNRRSRTFGPSSIPKLSTNNGNASGSSASFLETRTPSPEAHAIIGCVPKGLLPSLRQNAAPPLDRPPQRSASTRRVTRATLMRPDSPVDLKRSVSLKRKPGFRATVLNLFRRSEAS